jgi:hypothetical protein
MDFLRKKKDNFHWTCECGVLNFTCRPSCKNCGFLDTNFVNKVNNLTKYDWLCNRCYEINNIKNKKCEVCETVRPILLKKKN